MYNARNWLRQSSPFSIVRVARLIERNEIEKRIVDRSNRDSRVSDGAAAFVTKA